MENCIGIQPLGKVDQVMIQYLLDNLPQQFYGPIKLLDEITPPAEAFDLPRRQYLSTELLRTVLRARPPEMVKVLGITESDIFIPVFTYVFGEAQLGGPAALISLYRLRPEHYGALPNLVRWQERMLKEAFHELGHTFGLIHCPETSCIMFLSNTIKEIDIKSTNFCPSCTETLNNSFKKLR